tara:strand:+ start:4057 stop:4926 length:870 start_codon:yes stop_codon:yes gene_type:complete
MFDELRPNATYPTYPPYHTGKYLEEYFFDYYQRSIDDVSSNLEYLPIFWTNCYVNGVQQGWGDQVDISYMQVLINQLNPSGKYFTVCQHDDAPMNILPQNTVVFSAGGNVVRPYTIPIPLICGRLPEQPKLEKEYLASFVGSTTHNIRNSMIDSLKDHSDVYLSTGGWNPEVKDEQLQDFITASLKSKFVLCPRGYGASSFRLYEAMQLDAVPVYISDRFWLPWQYELNWEEFSVLITEDQIPDIYTILSSIDDDTYQKMKQKINELYENYFTMEGMSAKILQIVERIE